MDEYSTTPNHFAKKSREIDVWFREDYFEIIDDPPTKNKDKFVKAKLIVPVEPEIVECDCSVNQGVVWLDKVTLNKLDGRRWKCKFEEIV